MEFENILNKYGIENISNVQKLTGGVVNDTFLVEDSTNKYVFQKLRRPINPTIFENQILLREFISQKMPAPEIIFTKDGESFILEDGQYYILSKYIPNDKIIRDEESCYQAGKGLAIFHDAVKNIPKKQYSSIKIHDTTHYVSKLKTFISNPEYEKKHNQIKPYLDFIRENMQKHIYISQTMNHFIHGDSKFENMLFRDKKFLCMIDLDTFCFHNIYMDIGDMMRSLCKDKEFNFISEHFESALQGYSQNSNASVERQSLIDATGLIILQLGYRYIINFFDNGLFQRNKEAYSSSEEHNLKRIQNYIKYYENFINYINKGTN